MDSVGLAGIIIGGFTSMCSGLAGLIAVVYRGNKKARQELDAARKEVEDLRGKVLHSQGLVYRLRQVLVAHGWMSDPDLLGAAADVVQAAERGEA